MAKNAVTDWDETAANNLDVGGVNIAEGMSPSGVNDAMREMMAQIAKLEGADSIASATTTDLGSVPGRYVSITGTTTITSFGTVTGGTLKFVTWSNVLTLTYNATSMILPGAANITTAANDTAVFVSRGSGNWRCIAYQRANGNPVVPSLTLGTAQATTSGTAINFTGVPSWAKRVTLNLVGVSTDASSDLLIQLGDSGGIETTGYLGSGTSFAGTLATTGYTTGFGVATQAAYVHQAKIHIDLVDAATNTWLADGNGSTSDSARTYIVSGSKSLTGTLDRVRITTLGGTANFDAGSANISYE